METQSRSGWAIAMVVLSVIVGLALLAWLVAVAIVPLLD